MCEVYMFPQKHQRNKNNHPSHHPKLGWYLLLLALFFGLRQLNALSTDKYQAMQIQADHFTFNNKTHRASYMGHVQVNQGTTHASGSNMQTLNNHNNKLQEIILTGNPAKYQTLPEKNKGILYTQATTIYYFVSKHLVRLIGHAKATRSHHVLKSHRIVYNIKKQIVSTPKSIHSQTTIILPPQGKQTSS